jgi:hypothetical protein
MGFSLNISPRILSEDARRAAQPEITTPVKVNKLVDLDSRFTTVFWGSRNIAESRINIENCNLGQGVRTIKQRTDQSHLCTFRSIGNKQIAIGEGTPLALEK